MSLRTLRRLVYIALSVTLGAYAVLSGFARRPLYPAEFWIFGAAVLRATPAHLGGSNPVETLRLGGGAFGSPTGAALFSMAGEAYTIPLPPRTICAESAHAQSQRFITFATPQELHAYLRSTLPRAGWRYREQLGSMHALERGNHVLSVRSTFYVGTRVGELRISLQARQPIAGNRRRSEPLVSRNGAETQVRNNQKCASHRDTERKGRAQRPS